MQSWESVEQAFAIGDDIRNVIEKLKGNEQRPKLSSSGRVDPSGRDPATEPTKRTIGADDDYGEATSCKVGV